MATKDYEVQDDVWIGNVEQKPIDPESAVAGAFRLKKGEKITSERARAIGLLKTKADDAVEEKAVDAPAEDKAVNAAPENKARTRTATKRR